MMYRAYALPLLGSALVLFPSAAQAYIGPGAALGLVGYFFGLAGAVVVAVVLVAYYPLKLLLRRIKAKRRSEAGPDRSSDPH